jgi:hypothetical protein
MQGDLFIKQQVVVAASTQKLLSIPTLDIMQRALEMMVLFNISTMPFC